MKLSYNVNPDEPNQLINCTLHQYSHWVKFQYLFHSVCQSIPWGRCTCILWEGRVCRCHHSDRDWGDMGLEALEALFLWVNTGSINAQQVHFNISHQEVRKLLTNFHLKRCVVKLNEFIKCSLSWLNYNHCFDEM